MILETRETFSKLAAELRTTPATGKIVIEAGCLPGVTELCAQEGLSGPAAAIYDENTWRAAAGRRPAASWEVVLPKKDLHANERGVALLEERLPEGAAYLIAVGAGTVHDLTRYCACQRGIPFVSCPTAASVDGFCSSVAAMTMHGAKKTVPAAAPKLVAADLDVIAAAPAYLAASGFGDMMGKYIALSDWEISHILTGEFYCEAVADLMREALALAAGAAEGIGRREPEAIEKLTYGLLLSGVAMQLMGNSRPASGAEHHISHMIEMAPHGISSTALHGEKVGVGTVLASGEYRRLAAQTAPAWHSYRPYEREELEAVYGETLAGELIKENQNDVAEQVIPQRLAENWDAVREIVSHIPAPETLRVLNHHAGAMTELEEIGVAQAALPVLQDHSPAVRNRLTLMRLRRCMAF